MNAFLVITGVVIVALLIALWVVKQFNIQTKLWGIPLKYILDIALILVAITAIIVVKVALGNKSKALDALLAKLQISQANNKISILDDHIATNQTAITSIDTQIKNLQGSSCAGQIDALTKQKEDIQKQIDDLNSQKQTHTDNKSSLEDRVKQMEDRLNG
jgi:septal ring factor EnvC (AmiA/AmiB activator)